MEQKLKTLREQLSAQLNQLGLRVAELDAEAKQRKEQARR